MSDSMDRDIEMINAAHDLGFKKGVKTERERVGNLTTAVRGLRHFYDTTDPDFKPDEQESAEIRDYVVKAILALNEMENDR